MSTAKVVTAALCSKGGSVWAVGGWVVAGLSPVPGYMPHRERTRSVRGGRRTLFPVNVLENMNIISRKRKLQHLRGSRQADRQGSQDSLVTELPGKHSVGRAPPRPAQPCGLIKVGKQLTSTLKCTQQRNGGRTLAGRTLTMTSLHPAGSELGS